MFAAVRSPQGDTGSLRRVPLPNTLLTIVLIVLVAAGIWALVELALVFKRLRGTLDVLDNTVSDLNKSVNKTIEDLQPILENVDATVKSLQPTIQEVQPLLNKAGTTIDALSLDLLRVDEILADVSDITNTAANATSAVGGVASNASDVANSVLGKVKSKLGSKKQEVSAALEAGAPAVEEPVVTQEYFTLEPPVATTDEGYFKYPSPNGSDAADNQ